MTHSKISVDLKARSFEIEVPDARVDEVLTRLEAFFRLPVEVEPEEVGTPSSNGSGNEQPTALPEVNTGNGKRRTRGGSKVRAYELLDLGLDEQQRSAVRAYYSEKAPLQQNDKVAVLAVKLKEFLSQSEFSADEIHSAFKIVSEATPKNLVAVFGNMKRDGIAGYRDLKVIVNSHTEDHVNFHMTKKREKKTS